MGQLINFHSLIGDNSNLSNDKYYYNILNCLPHLRQLANSTVIIQLNDHEVSTPDVINRIAKECVTMKSMGVDVIVVLDCTYEINNISNDEKLQNDIKLAHFAKGDEEGNLFNLIEAVATRDFAKVFTKLIIQSNGTPVIIAGRNANIVFEEEFFSGNSASNYVNTHVPHFSLAKNFRKFNVDLLHELTESATIIPVLLPTFLDNTGAEYIATGAVFATTIAQYLQATKVILSTNLELDDLNNSTVGASQVGKMMSNKKYNEAVQKQINLAVDSVKTGVQTVHIVNLATTSIIEELCSNISRGILIYDDISTQI